MDLSKKELGLLVKKARKLKSEKINKLYTQKMLANDLGNSQSSIGDIESGRTYPSFILLSKIAKACEVSLSFFEDTNQVDKTIDKFIKLQLDDATIDDINKIREQIKNDPDLKLNYVYDYVNNSIDNLISSFKAPEELIRFILLHPVMKEFLGINTSSLSESEICGLVTDILNQMKLISYKYKKS